LTELEGIVLDGDFAISDSASGDYFRFRLVSALAVFSSLFVWLNSAQSRWSNEADERKLAGSSTIDGLRAALRLQQRDIEDVIQIAQRQQKNATDDLDIGVKDMERLNISAEEHDTEEEGVGARESYSFMQSWRASADTHRSSGARGFSRSSFGSERSVVLRNSRDPRVPARIDEEESEFDESEDEDDDGFKPTIGLSLMKQNLDRYFTQENRSTISSEASDTIPPVPDLPRVLTDQSTSTDNGGIAGVSTPSPTRSMLDDLEDKFPDTVGQTSKV
jgi:hypothetical protein